MSLEMSLREQVVDLADQGDVLGVASAVVGAEHDRLYYYGDSRAAWEPSAGPFAEPIGMPDIRMERRPVIVNRHPVVISLCSAEFVVGSDVEGFTADEQNEAGLADDEWVVGLLARFVHAYCGAEHTRNLPATNILPRSQKVETETQPSQPPLRIVDNRKIAQDLRYRFRA